MTLEESALYLAGVIASPFLQWVKGKFFLDGKIMFFVTVAVSFLIALAAFFLSGEDYSLETIFVGFSKVVTTATIVYNFVLAEH